MKNLTRETLNRRPCLSGNKCGFLSAAATFTLVLIMTLPACVAASAAQFSLSAPVLFEGAVDGSAGADVGGGFFVGATDEKNKLRLYDAKGGLPARTLDVGLEPA